MASEFRELKRGDEIKCWRCSNWHVLHTASVPSPASPMLFITCRRGEYYAGGEALETDRLTRPPQIQGTE